MSHKNTPLDENYNLIVDGKKTNIPGIDADTIKQLRWNQYLNNRYKSEVKPPVEKNKEYF